MKIGVSACLLGRNCKYNGKSNYNSSLCKLLEGHEIIPICPETMGGLSTPRTPCEIIDGKVISKTGTDCTYEYTKGSQIAYDLVKDCDLIILQKRSPSCSNSQIYDGTFSGTLISGKGIFAEMVNDLKIPILEADAEKMD